MKSQFDLNFDILIIAAGSETNTFGCKGVEDNKHVFFLKQFNHSRGIRNRLIECFERASSPGIEAIERKRLLTFVIVGGGPTSVEFAAEVYDFLQKDVSRWYPELLNDVSVKLIEASGHIMGTFNESLVNYTERIFSSRKVELCTNVSVKEIRDHVAILSTGEELSFGLMVWSTGVKPVSMINELNNATLEYPDAAIAKSNNGRILVNNHLQVMYKNKIKNEVFLTESVDKLVFAMGDCAANQTKPLPALAQVAQQQGSYLAMTLNQLTCAIHPTTNKPTFTPLSSLPAFQYMHMGAMASIGDWKAVYDSGSIDSSRIPKVPPIKGIIAFLLWRAAYWTRSVSWTNKILIPMYWFKSALFGRDISRF